MNADIKGALNQINKYYKVFEFEGMPMNKEWVRRCLEYGIMKGYETTYQIPEDEIRRLKFESAKVSLNNISQAK